MTLLINILNVKIRNKVINKKVKDFIFFSYVHWIGDEGNKETEIHRRRMEGSRSPPF